MIMKNKFYFTKKNRASFYALMLVFLGLATSSLHAQTYTHTWKGLTGNWNVATNWYDGNGVSMTDATTYPGEAAASVVQINGGGTCTLTATLAFSLKSLIMGNTSATDIGKLIIDNGVTLSASNHGGPNVNQEVVVVIGGLIENLGTIASAVTSANGAPIRFRSPVIEPTIDWGIIGAGNFAINFNGAAATQGAFQVNSTVTNAPVLTVNQATTFASVNGFSGTVIAAFVNLVDNNSKLKIRGTGFTSSLNVPLIKLATFATIDIDSSVTLSGTGVGGTITWNANSVITNRGKIINPGIVTNNGKLVLVSTATSNGYLVSNTSIANVTQERYLTSNQRGWRLLSNPLADVTYGSVATLSTTPLTLGIGTAKTYDSTTGAWTISNTDDTQTWGSKQAISLFVRGRTSEVTTTTYSINPPSNVTVSVAGIASNAVPSTVITASTSTGQYYLVANPYTAPVSVSSILAASTGLKSTISYFNPTIGSNGTTDLTVKKGGYDYPTPSGAAGSATDVIIPPMGAFFVQAMDNTVGTINVPNTAIFTGTPISPSGNYNHKSAQSKVAATTALKLEVTGDNTYYDTLALQFKEVGTAGSNIDFGKLPNTILDAYSIAGANKMAVSELELAAQTIPLGITSTEQKSFTFKVVENTIPVGYEAVLVDSVLNTNTVLAPNTTYDFAIDSAPASQGDARFAINLKTAGSLGVKDNELDSKIQLWPNPATSQVNITNNFNNNEGASAITITNVNGQVIHSQKSAPGATTSIQTNNWSKGVYFVKASNNGTKTIKKLIIQ